MNKESKQDNIRKNEHKRLNKSKVIKISLSLFVVIIFVILFAVSLQIFKTTKTGVEVTKNLAESATETFEYSEDEQTEENAGEVEDEGAIDDDSEVSAISEATDDESTDDGVSTIDDSSDYTITVAEYTGDTLEAEFDYGESGKFILYIVDAESWQLQNAYTFSYTDTTVYSFSDYYSLEDGMRCGTSPIFVAESMRGMMDISYTYDLTLAITDISNMLFQGGSGSYSNGVKAYEERR